MVGHLFDAACLGRLTGVVFWLIGHVGQALLLLAIGAVLAYTIYLLVKQVQRFLPQPLAIALVYLLVLVLLSILVTSSSSP